MDRIGRLYYWLRTETGPKQGAIIYPDRVVQIDFTQGDAATKISQADAESAVATALGPTKVNKGWTAEYIGPQNNTRWASASTLTELAELVRAQKAKEFAEEEAIKADPVRHLERELGWADWYYEYSDDHRVWLGGEAHFRLIRQLIKKIPVEKAKELWAKYAPNDTPFPFGGIVT